MKRIVIYFVYWKQSEKFKEKENEKKICVIAHGNNSSLWFSFKSLVKCWVKKNSKKKYKNHTKSLKWSYIKVICEGSELDDVRKCANLWQRLNLTRTAKKSAQSVMRTNATIFNVIANCK